MIRPLQFSLARMVWSVSLFSAGIGLFTIVQRHPNIPESFPWLYMTLAVVAAFAAVGMIGASVFMLVGRWRVGLLVAWVFFAAAIGIGLLFHI